MVAFMSINSAIENPPTRDGHAQRMDRMYKVQRHFYDITRAYYLLGRNERIAALKPPSGGSVLEIGCGTGRNLIVLARQYPDACIYGVDISEEMLISAARAVERHGLRHRVKLAQGDATTFDGTAFGKLHYDRILFSYTLSMIPDWQQALQNAVAHLAAFGELHVVDFGPCDELPGIAKTALYAWLDRFHVTPRTSLIDVVEDLSKAHKMTAHLSLSHRSYAQHAVISNSQFFSGL